MAPSTPTPEVDAGAAWVVDAADASTPDAVGIVLAAGAGRRMGGPKALVGPLAEGGGTPLARVCSWVHEAGCARVIAVIGAQSDAVRAALAADPVWLDAGPPTPGGTQWTPSAYPRPDAAPALPTWLTVVEASEWASGMGASLRAGLAAAAESGAPGGRPVAALITLVDLPDVRTAVYRRVLSHSPGPDALARASYLGRPGHPVVIGRDHWDAAASAAVGDQGARALFATTPHRLIECGDLASGVDADAPA